MATAFYSLSGKTKRFSLAAGAAHASNLPDRLTSPALSDTSPDLDLDARCEAVSFRLVSHLKRILQTAKTGFRRRERCNRRKK